MTNYVPGVLAPDFGPSTASSLQFRWLAHLDGPVIASPLYADGVTIAGSRENVVYAATQDGSVYGVDAATGVVIWQRQLGTAVSTCDEDQAGVGGVYGIASTGVIDRSRNVLYVIGASGVLYALALDSGKDAAGWPVQVVTDTSGEYVWGGLTEDGDKLYVPVASYCDVPGTDGQYATGRLMAVDLDTRAVVATFQVVPDAPNALGGIWGWGGASIDPVTGDLWTTTGNSWFYDKGCGCIDQSTGYAEAAVELDPNLNVLASNRPDTVPGENDDADFGSTPLLFQPPGCPPLAAAYAKTGYIYIWRRDSLASGPIWSFHGGPSDISSTFAGEPSYSPDLNELVVADARAYDDTGAISHFDAVTAFAVGPGCSFPNAPTWVSPDVGRGPKAPALIVGDLAFVVGGFDPDVYVLDATSGAVVWTTGMNGAALAPPAFGDDQVYLGDASGTLTALGIGPAPPPPPPPTPPARLTVGKLTHTAAHAGKPLAASISVKNHGEPVKAKTVCTAKLADRTLKPEHSLAVTGRASCVWKLPSSAHGKRFRGAIGVVYHGTTIVRKFAATVQ